MSMQSARVEELHELNATMRNQLAVHHQLISDVRSILKTMAKVKQNMISFRKIRNYIVK